MEVFEVHITGDKSIHDVAKILGQKTIAIDLLNPDGTVLREEHMTSLIFKYAFSDAYLTCLKDVLQLAENYRNRGVNILRVKIESPPYKHYESQSLYMESHFISDRFKFPTSRNQRKTTLLATDRTYDQSNYANFSQNNQNADLELALYDSQINEDQDWFSAYAQKS